MFYVVLDIHTRRIAVCVLKTGLVMHRSQVRSIWAPRLAPVGREDPLILAARERHRQGTGGELA
jgi:hypothetical protein